MNKEDLRKNDQTQKPSWEPKRPLGWPEPLAEAAYHGLVGDIVRTIEPQTEADPAAILVQLLVGIGSAVGSTPHFTVESDKHGLKLFVSVVGQSAKARKGTSWGHVRRLLEIADPTWAKQRVQTGLSSGEGLIEAVRDGRNGDLGVIDKRLLVIESELAKALKAMARDGNTLSAVLRQAWDGGRLGSLTRAIPLSATDAHVSVIGHITFEDLASHLTKADIANGFGNRFLWVLGRRSKLLPEGGHLQEEHLRPFAEKLKDAVAYARSVGELKRDAAAGRRWREVYPILSEEREGAYGAITSRAEAQVMRIASIYALMDQSLEIRLEHLDAALEVWRYCDDSARFIFRDKRAAVSPVARRLRDELLAAPQGLTRTNIRDLFSGNVKAPLIEAELERLRDAGKAHVVREPGTIGRPSERWFYGPAAEAQCDEESAA
jgi:hypothetical protein